MINVAFTCGLFSHDSIGFSSIRAFQEFSSGLPWLYIDGSIIRCGRWRLIVLRFFSMLSLTTPRMKGILTRVALSLLIACNRLSNHCVAPAITLLLLLFMLVEKANIRSGQVQQAPPPHHHCYPSVIAPAANLKGHEATGL